jgi:preprotein translocase subunit SecG
MEALRILQIIISVLLILSILLQNRGAGSSGIFGGGGATVYSSKRGMEKFLFKITIVLAAAFIIVSAIVVIK